MHKVEHCISCLSQLLISGNGYCGEEELIPVMIASFLWGQNWKGYKVTVFCDNEAVVHVLNNHYSRDCHLAYTLRILFFIEAYFQCKVKSKHIPGTCNTLADHLSRNRIDKFHAEYTNACNAQFNCGSSSHCRRGRGT